MADQIVGGYGRSGARQIGCDGIGERTFVKGSEPVFCQGAQRRDEAWLFEDLTLRRGYSVWQETLVVTR